MPRGQKPGTLRKGSLASKMAQLLPGQWFVIPDREAATPDAPTLQERNVQTNLFRSPALEGFTISTSRVLIVNQDWTTERALKITREA